MPKYYIHSGSLDFVTDAADAGSAALWALHCWLDARCIPESPEDREWDEDELVRLFDAISGLDEHVLVSESGSGHNDAGIIETGALFDEWRRLWQAVSRIK